MNIILQFEGAQIKWGSNHPHGDSNGYRIPWSDAEKDYIGEVVEEMRRLRGVIPVNICQIIKDRIFNDRQAHAIFHAHHSLDSARIRAGYEAYIKREEKRRQL